MTRAMTWLPKVVGTAVCSEITQLWPARYTFRWHEQGLMRQGTRTSSCMREPPVPCTCTRVCRAQLLSFKMVLHHSNTSTC